MKVLLLSAGDPPRTPALGLSFAGDLVELSAGVDALDWAAGEVWVITSMAPATAPGAPVVVTGARPQPPLADAIAFVASHRPVSNGALTGLEAAPVFWQSGQPLTGRRQSGATHFEIDGVDLAYRGAELMPAQLPPGSLFYLVPAGKDGAWQLRAWLAPSYEDFGPPPEDSYAEDMAVDLALDLEWGDAAPLQIADRLAPLQAAPPAAPATLAGARQLLKDVFGYDNFRPLQAEIIETLLAGDDAVVIMPTGSGKSLCYQLPALLWSGLTVVVSPLISLMQDQVSQLLQLEIPAAFLNSSLPPAGYQQVLDQIRYGALKLLYVAPETLLRPDVIALLAGVRVDCLAIDEAHCISAWGHDFRPEYRRLVEARQRLAGAACIALTATATPRVRGDIRDSLSLDAAQEFISSFDRENLYLAVEPRQNGLRQLEAFLGEHKDQAGIIYAATRKQVDTLAGALKQKGWSVLPYHAGMDAGRRREHQRLFTFDEVDIIVATVAFGMGIDKSNVRFVVHYDLPKDVESYYQQIGRAGRDGVRADCLLLFDYNDVHTIRHFIRSMPPGMQKGASARLQALLRFAETTICRRRPLLDYFGETYANEVCDFCDNCLGESLEAEDITVPAQKFLSCVKRTGEIFGLNYVIDVLRGSRAQRIFDKGHDRLSTYGIGQEFGRADWQVIARQLLAQGLLDHDPRFGGLRLTPAAYEVFRGEPVMGHLPRPAAVGPGAGQAPPHDNGLFRLLAARRKELAAAGNVPPYVVFSDQALIEMATYFPHTEAEFADMYGVGAAKLKRYAPEFLPLIRDYCRDNDLQSRPKGGAAPAAAPAADSSGDLRPRTLELVGAFLEAPDVAALAAAQGIQAGTVLEHLWQYMRAGNELPAAGLLTAVDVDEAMRQRALAAFAAKGTEFLRPVFEALDGAVSYDNLKALRLYYLATQQLE